MHTLRSSRRSQRQSAAPHRAPVPLLHLSVLCALFLISLLLTRAAGMTATSEASPAVDTPTNTYGQRVIVLSNLNGDILRLKTLLVLSGLAEVVDGATADVSASGPPPPRRRLASAAPAVSVSVIDKPEDPTALRNRRATRAAAAAKSLAAISTGRLRLTDACTHTSVVLLGNSVGRHPHSHEIIDLFAQLRREAVETLEDCTFHYVLGGNELNFLTGNIPFLSYPSTSAAAASTAGVSVMGSGAFAVVPPVPTKMSMRERQWERQALSAFGNTVAALRESYSPYGDYGRFLLNHNNVLLRYGDTVFAHGGIIAPFSRLGVRRLNAAFLESFKEFYDQAQLRPQQPRSTLVKAASDSSDSKGDERDPRMGDVNGEEGEDPHAYRHPFSARYNSPLHDQTIVLAATARDSNCEPLRRALDDLTAAEGTRIRRMVVAGSAATTAVVAAVHSPSASPLAPPISVLCDGQLVIVAGGERQDGLLAALELRREPNPHNGDHAAAAAVDDDSTASFSARPLYLLGTHTLVSFDHLHQPVAAPRGARTVRATMSLTQPVLNVAAAKTGPERQAKPLHVSVAAAAGGEVVAMQPTNAPKRDDLHHDGGGAGDKRGLGVVVGVTPVAAAAAANEFREARADPLAAGGALRGLRRAGRDRHRAGRWDKPATRSTSKESRLLRSVLFVFVGLLALLRLTRLVRTWVARSPLRRNDKSK